MPGTYIRTEENKRKIRESLLKTYKERPEILKNRKRSVIKHTKESKRKTSETLKNTWQRIKNSPHILERNRKISKALIGHKTNEGSGVAKGGIREDIGHYVRSSWEANFCRLLKSKNIKYEYEPKTFWLNDNNREITYTPDIFYNNKFIEIKGMWRVNDKRKVELFIQQYPNIKIIIIDSNKYSKLQKRYSKVIKNWE